MKTTGRTVDESREVRGGTEPPGKVQGELDGEKSLDGRDVVESIRLTCTEDNHCEGAGRGRVCKNGDTRSSSARSADSEDGAEYRAQYERMFPTHPLKYRHTRPRISSTPLEHTLKVCAVQEREEGMPISKVSIES